MLDFLRLIRYKNLLIIAVTQYLMRYCIINPILKVSGLELQLDNFHFVLLVLSSVLITAAGYVINDYFDTGTDMLNRPETVLVGKTINRRMAMLIHILLNILGISIGIYLSVKINILALGVAYLLASGILWFYSTTYKRQFLIGNLIVAIFTGMVPFIVALFEVPLLNQQYKEILIRLNMNFNSILGWVGGFSFFAFLSTLVREIIKDIEDFKGDRAFGRNTIPVVAGIRVSKIIVVCIILINIFALLYIYFSRLLYTNTGKIDFLTLSYFIVLLIIPFMILTFLIIKADKKNDYHRASNLTKFIMLAGILYSLVAFVIITRTF
jgi:4-hydroxybenzoate polyprenyltransferase